MLWKPSNVPVLHSGTGIPTLCSVSCASSKLLGILYVGSPLSFVAQAFPGFTGICGGDHAGDTLRRMGIAGH
jgi:hypothetical protein